MVGGQAGLRGKSCPLRQGPGVGWGGEARPRVFSCFGACIRVRVCVPRCLVSRHDRTPARIDVGFGCFTCN